MSISKPLKVIFPALLLPAFMFIFLVGSVFSATLTLTKIGALDTSGKLYSEWWYSSTTAVLSGAATDGTQVSVKVDEQANQVNVASGVWSYTLTGEAKDYNIVISQGDENITFVLHLGQAYPTDATSEEITEGVPDTGFNQIIAITLGTGIILLASYFYFWGDLKKKSVFEAKIIRED